MTESGGIANEKTVTPVDDSVDAAKSTGPTPRWRSPVEDEVGSLSDAFVDVGRNLVAVRTSHKRIADRLDFAARKPKKRWPFQLVPVIALAIRDRLP
jgi:hypothetical protein